MSPPKTLSPPVSLSCLGDWLEWVMDLLEKHDCYLGHGTDNYWDEALGLVFNALSLPFDADRSILKESVDSDGAKKVLDFLNQRVIERKPLPYITGQAWFMGLPFNSDERALIPRSPLGEWIKRRFQPFIDTEKVHRIVDIGTGSGCLAIALALSFPQAAVDALDICPEALALAKENVENYELSERVKLVESDALTAVLDQQYDLIVANPPYVPQEEAELIPLEYSFEPSKALYAGEDGLDIVRRIIDQSVGCLSPHGVMIIEVGQNSDALLEAYPDFPFIWLTCDNGGEGLALLDAKDLAKTVG